MKSKGVGNAIKYRSKDRDPQISIESENHNGKIKLTITDNGLGINLERHGNKIFGLNIIRFYHSTLMLYKLNN